MTTKKATLQQIRDAWKQWEADRKMAWQVLVEIGAILKEDDAQERRLKMISEDARRGREALGL